MNNNTFANDKNVINEITDELLSKVSGGYEKESTNSLEHMTVKLTEEEVNLINQKYNVDLKPDVPYTLEFLRQIIK